MRAVVRDCSGTLEILDFRRGRFTCAPGINGVPVNRTRGRYGDRARERTAIVPEIEPRESIANAISTRDDVETFTLSFDGLVRVDTIGSNAQRAGRELKREEAAGMRIDATAFYESEIC